MFDTYLNWLRFAESLDPERDKGSQDLLKVCSLRPIVPTGIGQDQDWNREYNSDISRVLDFQGFQDLSVVVETQVSAS